MSTRPQKIFDFIFSHACLSFTLLYIILRLLFQPSVYVDNTMVSCMAAWGDPHPFLIYIGYINGLLITQLRLLIPQVEWFSVILFLVNLGSVAILAHCSAKRTDEPLNGEHFVGAAILLIYMAVSLLYPYYSLVSAAGIASALFLMLHANKKKTWWEFILGTIFLLLAASVRYDSCLQLLPFCGVLFTVFFLKKEYHRLLAPVTATCIVLFVHLLQPLCAEYSPWETDVAHPVQNAIKINDVRMRFFDYDDRLEKDKLADFAAAGLSENDLKILAASSYQLERRSEPGWFDKLGEIRMRDNGKFPTSWRTFLHRMKLSWETSRFGFDYFYIWPLVLGLAFLPFPSKKTDWRIIIFAVFLLNMSLLYLMGRDPLTPVLAVVYVTTPLMLWARGEDLQRHQASSPIERKFLSVPGTAVTIVFISVIAALLPNFSPLKTRYPDPAYYHMLRQECNAHPELNYYIPIWHWGWKTIPSGVMASSAYTEIANLLPDKDYMYLAPSMQSELKKRGIPSDLTILLQENTRFIYQANERHERAEQRMKYWEEHHGIKLHLEMERCLNEKWAVFKVVREPGGDDVPLKPLPFIDPTTQSQ